MRTIKFRAWDKRFKTMDFGAGDLLLRINERDFSEPEQFTGLHDKNGKEIYEGDIIDWKDSKKKWVVEYWEARFGLTEIINHPIPLHENLTTGRQKYLEVIGNIHENQELLPPKPRANH